jgi:Uma2 family endonuclease
LTVAQYLEIERAADFRSEYVDGEVVAMSGGSRRHALIDMAVGARLDEQLRGRPCAVAGSDLRLYSKPSQILTYPDIVVFCEPAQFLDGDEDTLTDAIVIVEILSKSTRNFDRGEKFHCYRGLPSFQEYILVDQDAIRAEHYVRQSHGAWLMRELSDPEAVLRLDSIGWHLNLGSLYKRIKFKT